MGNEPCCICTMQICCMYTRLCVCNRGLNTNKHVCRPQPPATFAFENTWASTCGISTMPQKIDLLCRSLSERRTCPDVRANVNAPVDHGSLPSVAKKQRLRTFGSFSLDYGPYTRRRVVSPIGDHDLNSSLRDVSHPSCGANSLVNMENDCCCVVGCYCTDSLVARFIAYFFILSTPIVFCMHTLSPYVLARARTGEMPRIVEDAPTLLLP